MADYYINFSLVIGIPSESALQYALILHNQACGMNQEDTPLPPEFPDELRDYIEGWCFEVESCGDNMLGPERQLWIHSQNGGIDSACAFIQHLLNKFDPTGVVTLEWSNDCSKPRTDAYGGGAAIITSVEVKTMSTSEWMRQQLYITKGITT
jgi:hypothetical protein